MEQCFSLSVHNFNFIISYHSALLFSDPSVGVMKREISWPGKTIFWRCCHLHTFLKGPVCPNESALAQLVSEHFYVFFFILCLPVAAWSWQVDSSGKFWTTQPHSQPKSKPRGNHNPCGTISLGKEQMLLCGWVRTSSSLRFHLQRFFCS